MQVSWINPEDVAALAESLRQPVRQPAPAAQPLPEPPAEPLVVENPPLPVPAGTPAPDLAAFREKLQSIRDKAISAGLLSATVEAPAPVPAPPPVFTPAPAAVIPPSPPPETISAARAFQSEQGLRWAAPATPALPPAEVTPSAEVASFEPAAEPEAAFSASPASFAPPVDASIPAPSPAPEAVVFPPAVVEVPAPADIAPAPAPEPAAAEVPMSSFGASPAPQPEVPVSAAATVKERLEAYAQWANQKWGAQELLIVDEFGDLLWGPPKKSGLVLSTMMAWNAAIRASAQAASGVVQTRQQMLPAGESLTLIPCSTRLGLLQIALVKAQAPWENETASLRETLQQVMDAHG